MSRAVFVPNFPLPSLGATADQARALAQPPANPLAHLPQVVAQLRAEIQQLKVEKQAISQAMEAATAKLQAEVAALKQQAIRRAQREERLARHTIWEVDHTALFQRRLRVIITGKVLQVIDYPKNR